MNAPVSPPAPPARGRRSLLVWGVVLSVVLLLALGLIAWHYRLQPDPGCIEYPMLRARDIPTAVAAAPDGAVWFTETGAGKIGRLDPATIPAPAPVPALSPLALALCALMLAVVGLRLLK